MASAKQRKDEAILSALLASPSVRQAATVCGVSESLIFKRLKDPAFKDRYDEARHGLLEQSTCYLQAVIGEALQKMYQIMNDPDVPPQTQLNAANSLAANSMKFTEQADILQQLAELKKAVLTDE